MMADSRKLFYPFIIRRRERNDDVTFDIHLFQIPKRLISERKISQFEHFMPMSHTDEMCLGYANKTISRRHNIKNKLYSNQNAIALNGLTIIRSNTTRTIYMRTRQLLFIYIRIYYLRVI